MEEATEKMKKTWRELEKDGKILMPLKAYEFSPLYGWVQDRFGFSWQLFLSDPKGEKRPFVMPSLMFTGISAGRAEEAIDFYASIFETGERGMTAKYLKGAEPNKEGTIMYADFHIFNTWMAVMDSGKKHNFTFNEAISLLIPCESQKEMDYYWDKLSAVPEAEQCGWLKDKFGVSWQVWPTYIGEVMEKGSPEQIASVMKSMMEMKKFELKRLEDAFKN